MTLNMLYVLQLLFLFLVLPFAPAEGFTNYNISRESRVVPSWDKYAYEETMTDAFVIREYVLAEDQARSYILCPRNASIAQIAHVLLSTKKNSTITKPFIQSALASPLPSDLGDRINEDSVPAAKDCCPTLRRCLLHQGCVFDFGTEFCTLDPRPGDRKNLDVNVTCMRDDAVERLLWVEHNGNERVAEFRKTRDQILHIKYKTHLEELTNAELDLSSTNFTFAPRAETGVFSATCPIDPYAGGFRGVCGKAPLDREVTQRAWHLMARTEDALCRHLLQQTLCSYMFNSSGSCVPPYSLEEDDGREDFSEVTFGHYSFPKRGERPPKLREKLLELKEQSSLIPVRIGFVLLVHQDVPAVLQLLEQIYRPQHFYVFHVDQRSDQTREQLVSELSWRFSAATDNVLVLPPHRSFVTSWGSFALVRAQTEAYEELCRMGLWDFAINLSGADMTLRSVEDLALALAPHRGESLFAFHLFQPRNQVKGKEGLAMEAYLACNGFVYNVTRTNGQPSIDDMEVWTASQWSSISRELIEEYLDQKSHSEVFRRHFYRMQTGIIPDESLLSTFSRNSLNHKNRTRHIGLFWTKMFNSRNTYNLCRRFDQADFCGQGPGFVDLEDMSQIAHVAHRYFFARKFLTNTTDDLTRKMVTELAQEEYYQFVYQNLHKMIIDQLSGAAAYTYFTKRGEGSTFKKKSYSLDVTSFSVIPRFMSSDPCCEFLSKRQFSSVQEYSYVIDFTLHERVNGGAVALRAKYDLVPQSVCYPRGDLHCLRLTTWLKSRTSSNSIGSKPNLPLPFAFAGSEEVSLENFFRRSNNSVVGEECDTEMLGKLIEVGHANDSLAYSVRLVDPKGNVRCTEQVRTNWTGLKEDPYGEKVELLDIVQLRCTPLEPPGIWKVELNAEEDPEDESGQTDHDVFVYSLPFVVLSPKTRLPEDDRELGTLMDGMFRFVDVISMGSVLPEDGQFPGQKCLSLRQDYSTQTPLKVLRRWLLCGGGGVTMLVCYLFTLKFQQYRRRGSKKQVFEAFVILSFSATLQMALSGAFCPPWE